MVDFRRFAIRLIAALALLSAPAYGQGIPDSWTEPGAPGPKISQSTALSVMGRLYSFGGLRPNWTYRNEVRYYDPLTDQWVGPLTSNLATSMPVELEGFGGTGVVIGGVCYLAGGSTAIGTGNRDVFIFDPATSTWSIAPGALNKSRTRAMATAHAGKMYLMGGLTTLYPSSMVSDVEVFDPAAPASTSTIASLPIPMGYGCAATVRDRIYCFSGLSGSGWTTACWEYDVSNPAGWIAKLDTPAPAIIYGATFTIGNRIYVVGGTDTFGGMQDVCWEFSPLELYFGTPLGVWRLRTQPASLPTYSPRTLLGAGTINGTGYVFGGQGVSGGLYQGTYAYTPDLGSAPGDPLNLQQVDAWGTPQPEGICFLPTDVVGFTADVTDGDAGDRVSIDVEVIDQSTGTVVRTVFGTYGATGTTAVAQVSGLPQGTYTWHCRSVDLAGNHGPGGWVSFATAAADFSIRPMPEAPVGISPINIDLITPNAQGRDVVFSWAPVSTATAATRYEVQVISSLATMNVVAQATDISGVTCSIFLGPNGSNQGYFWRVRTLDCPANLTWGWSTIQPFHVYYDDGIAHAAGDAVRACGFSVMGASSANLAWIALALLAIAIRRPL